MTIKQLLNRVDVKIAELGSNRAYEILREDFKIDGYRVKFKQHQGISSVLNLYVNEVKTGIGVKVVRKKIKKGLWDEMLIVGTKLYINEEEADREIIEIIEEYNEGKEAQRARYEEEVRLVEQKKELARANLHSALNAYGITMENFEDMLSLYNESK